MQLDVRENTKQEIDSIRYGGSEWDYLIKSGYRRITICPEDGGSVFVQDIDNLIKALYKAKELWENEKIEE